MLWNKSFMVEITGKLARQSRQGNMQKLFDCIRPLLKRFLACLTFHRKEIRLRHLHKRTNPGSAPEKALRDSRYTDFELKFNKISNNHTKRNQQRNIIWFNPPFIRAVSTNVGKRFLQLLRHHLRDWYRTF